MEVVVDEQGWPTLLDKAAHCEGIKRVLFVWDQEPPLELEKLSNESYRTRFPRGTAQPIEGSVSVQVTLVFDDGSTREVTVQPLKFIAQNRDSS